MPGARRPFGAEHAGDAEIGDLDRAFDAHQYVGRLHVAVDDAAAVGVFEGVEQLADDRRRLRPRQPPGPRQAAEQRFAADELHDDEPAVVMARAAVDAGDAGMIELGQGDGLGAEAIDRALPPGQLRLQHLQRHVAIEHLVEGAIHLAHAALTELLDQPVGAERLANHRIARTSRVGGAVTGWAA